VLDINKPANISALDLCKILEKNKIINTENMTFIDGIVPVVCTNFYRNMAEVKRVAKQQKAEKFCATIAGLFSGGFGDILALNYNLISLLPLSNGDFFYAMDPLNPLKNSDDWVLLGGNDSLSYIREGGGELALIPRFTCRNIPRTSGTKATAYAVNLSKFAMAASLGNEYRFYNNCKSRFYVEKNVVYIDKNESFYKIDIVN